MALRSTGRDSSALVINYQATEPLWLEIEPSGPGFEPYCQTCSPEKDARRYLPSRSVPATQFHVFGAALKLPPLTEDA